MSKLITLSISDFKLIFRDNSLRIFLVVPLFIILVILFLVPMLNEAYDGFEPFVPLILMGATLQTSTMYGFIYGMVLIHEKDIEVAKVYGVLPVSKVWFVLARLIIPIVMSILLTLIILVIQPFYEFPIVEIILLSIICGLISPVLTLAVAIISKNKMIGMTWFKLLNLVISLPLAAFFVPKYSNLFGIIPSHWAFQALDSIINGTSANFDLLVGFIYSILLLLIMVRRFAKVHFL